MKYLLLLLLLPFVASAQIPSRVMDWMQEAAVPKATIVSNYPTAGLVGSWKLDQANGATDQSGNGNNGSAQGGLSFGGTTNHHGAPNSATVFVSANSHYVSVSQKTGFNGTNGTISVWCLVNASTARVLFSYRLGSANQIRISGIAPATLTIYDSSTSVSRNIDVTIGTGTWHHFAFTWNSGTLHAYVDGADSGNVAYGTGSGVFNFGQADDFQIGHSSAYFSGIMSDFRLFNRPLNADEIAQLYNQ